MHRRLFKSQAIGGDLAGGLLSSRRRVIQGGDGVHVAF